MKKRPNKGTRSKSKGKSEPGSGKRAAADNEPSADSEVDSTRAETKQPAMRKRPGDSAADSKLPLPGEDLVIIYSVKMQPALVFTPRGFIRGPVGGVKPYDLQFWSPFQAGTLLSSCWLNGQVTFHPLLFDTSGAWSDMDVDAPHPMLI